MGACTFHHFHTGAEASVREAFHAAVEQSAWENGHGGYTGTLAEKHEYVVIKATETSRDEAEALADQLIDADDRRISDKWGPAGAIRTTDGWLFFGWASS